MIKIIALILSSNPVHWNNGEFNHRTILNRNGKYLMNQKSRKGRLQPTVTFMYEDIIQPPLPVKNGLLSSVEIHLSLATYTLFRSLTT